MEEHTENLMIACIHTAKGLRKGHYTDKEEEIFVCSECHKKIGVLRKKYPTGNIPIEELDFMITICRDCLFKNMKRGEK